MGTSGVFLLEGNKVAVSMKDCEEINYSFMEYSCKETLIENQARKCKIDPDVFCKADVAKLRGQLAITSKHAYVPYLILLLNVFVFCVLLDILSFKIFRNLKTNIINLLDKIMG